MDHLPLNPQDQQVILDIWSNNASLVEVWKCYQTTFLATSWPMSEAIDRFLDHLKEKKRTARYVAEMGWTLKALHRYLGNDEPVGHHMKSVVEDWLKRAGNTHTKKLKVSAFYGWLYQQKAIARRMEFNVSYARHAGEVGILSNTQVEQLIDRCPNDLIGHLWLCLCIGLRRAEAERVDHLEVRDGFLIVGAKASKTRARRVIQLLSGHEVYAGRVQAGVNMRKRMEALRLSAGIRKWPRNCMRHTAASHWLNWYGDEGKAGLHLGHAPAVLHRHYKALVTMKETEEFFRLWEVR